MKFRGKRLAVVVLDMLACVLALGLAVWLRFDGKIPEMYTPDLFFTYCGTVSYTHLDVYKRQAVDGMRVAEQIIRAYGRP